MPFRRQCLRTLLDLGAVVHQHRLEEALDSAERDGLVDREDLRCTLAIVRCQGRSGVGPLATLLEHRRGQQPRSVLERKMLRLLETHQLPRPLCQYRVVRPDGALADLDFAYPKERIGIEVDGHVGHATRRQRRNDYRRSNQVVLDDWRMLRFDYADVTRRADYVAETVRAALDASRDLK
jgi:very-short-patch-repair endonuclease